MFKAEGVHVRLPPANNVALCYQLVEALENDILGHRSNPSEMSAG